MSLSYQGDDSHSGYSSSGDDGQELGRKDILGDPLQSSSESLRNVTRVNNYETTMHNSSDVVVQDILQNDTNPKGNPIDN